MEKRNIPSFTLLYAVAGVLALAIFIVGLYLTVNKSPAALAMSSENARLFGLATQQ